MIDWTKSMHQSFEFHEVDPKTWSDKTKIDCIINSTIDRDISQSLLGSASFECTENLGEKYIRTYLVVKQDGITEKIPLGTHIVQSPKKNFDGMVSKLNIDAYSPLLELKENYPPIGYTLRKNSADALQTAYALCRDNMRAPVIPINDTYKLKNDYVADISEKWIDYVYGLLSIAGYSPSIDGMGKISFIKNESISKSESKWTYNDDNSSILYPDISIEQDLYGIPNAVEVIYTSNDGTLYSKVVNDSPDSPISTVSRGREITYRTIDPSIIGIPTQSKLDEYAEKLLESLSVLQNTITYKHGYCPVNIGDCITLNYKSVNLENVKARVTSQSISCKTGCPVTETAVYTTNLWR